MHTVRNSFWRPLGSEVKGSGPEFYTYRTEPIEYRGYEIFCVMAFKTRKGRWGSGQYDVVKDNVCIAQRMTLQGAKNRVDELISEAAA